MPDDREPTIVDIGFLKFAFKLKMVEPTKYSKKVNDWLIECEQKIKEEMEKQCKIATSGNPEGGD